MKKLGVVFTDPSKETAALAVLLCLVAAFTRLNVPGRIALGTSIVVAYALWRFRRYTFYEKSISILRPNRLHRHTEVVNAISVHRIVIYQHGGNRGNFAYVHYTSEGRKDVFCFGFSREQTFLLRFAALNHIAIDTGGISWAENEYSDIVANLDR